MKNYAVVVMALICVPLYAQEQSSSNSRFKVSRRAKIAVASFGGIMGLGYIASYYYPAQIFEAGLFCGAFADKKLGEMREQLAISQEREEALHKQLAAAQEQIKRFEQANGQHIADRECAQAAMRQLRACYIRTGDDQ